MDVLTGNGARAMRSAGGPAVAASEEREEFDALLRLVDDSRGIVALRDWTDLAEAWYITRALRRCSGNRSAAARALGIGRRTLYAKMEKLGIEPTWSSDGVRVIRQVGGD
jgi:DNA-binding NtrC family response regulator